MEARLKDKSVLTQSVGQCVCIRYKGIDTGLPAFVWDSYIARRLEFIHGGKLDRIIAPCQPLEVTRVMSHSSSRFECPYQWRLLLLTNIKDVTLYHSHVIAATRQAVANSRHRHQWYILFATTCSLTVVGLLSILSAVVHKVCMPAGSSEPGGMDMPSTRD